MQLTERTIIKQNHSQYVLFDQLSFKAKNLYNAGLYETKQHFFNTGKYKKWSDTVVSMRNLNNPDFRALPSKVSAIIIKKLGQDFNSFYQLLKKKQDKNYDKPVSIPKYKHKSKGRNVVEFPKDTIAKKPKLLPNGYYEHSLCPKDLNIKFLSKHEVLDIVRIVPENGYYVLEAVYTVDEVPELEDNSRYAGIDLGVNNIATLATNIGIAPLIYGGYVKSINQFYNKKLAKLKSELPGEVKTSKRIRSLHAKRAFKLDTEFHRISSNIVNHLVSNSINTLIIGYNKEWKQDINIGSRNNQNFVYIPYLKLVRQLQYKCEKIGIKVVLTEESYTSKCSFLDKELVQKYEKYVGSRVHRGLFKASGELGLLNADVNGALNIIRKVVPGSVIYSKGIEDYTVSPVRVKSTK